MLITASNCTPSRLGTVFWITGLSGAGKTSIGRELRRLIAEHNLSVVFLDGDMMREVFGDDLGHSRHARLKAAFRYSRLCKHLAEQGTNIVCATISMFNECQTWNRANIANYKEIYLRVPLSVLVQRDQKLLYSRALQGEIKDVMGIDIQADEPLSPDILIDNTGSQSVTEIAALIFDYFFPENLQSSHETR